MKKLQCILEEVKLGTHQQSQKLEQKVTKSVYMITSAMSKNGHSFYTQICTSTSCYSMLYLQVSIPLFFEPSNLDIPSFDHTKNSIQQYLSFASQPAELNVYLAQCHS